MPSTTIYSAHIAKLLACGALLATLGCGVDPDVDGPNIRPDVEDTDASTDATPDATPDVEPDTAPDLTPDLTPDVEPDTAPDLTPDTEPDAVSDPCSTVCDCDDPTTQYCARPPGVCLTIVVSDQRQSCCEDAATCVPGSACELSDGTSGVCEAP